MLNILKNLTAIKSPSGSEENLCEYILKEISPHAECRVDSMGNILALKKGETDKGNRIMVSAHMDEVGFMITGITDDGYLAFSTIGGILTSAFTGKRVTVNGRIGVIGIKPIHLTDKSEREKMPDSDNLYIDIGAKDKADAEKYVAVGDCGTFDTEFEYFGKDMIKSPALDDKVGVAIMIDIIKNYPLKADTYFTFVVQEEVGCRGAKTAAYTVDPDIALVLEATTSADIAQTDELNKVCKIGEGAVLSFMDYGTVYDKKLLCKITEIAKKNGIKHQLKTAVAGGNDSKSIHLSRGGVRTAAISLPCRYIHTASSVGSVSDICSMRSLVLSALNELYSTVL